MRLRWILFGVFLVIPIAEIALLVTFSRAVGVWWTIALVVTTAFLGSWLVSRQGRDTLVGVRLEFERGV
ncbi:MAG TPA: FxsA family protein, partial [Acidimicrobiia bacterium]|nr:FxsA family protein [Acidimicrobiia bacterium]